MRKYVAHLMVFVIIKSSINKNKWKCGFITVAKREKTERK